MYICSKYTRYETEASSVQRITEPGCAGRTADVIIFALCAQQRGAQHGISAEKYPTTTEDDDVDDSRRGAYVHIYVEHPYHKYAKRVEHAGAAAVAALYTSTHFPMRWLLWMLPQAARMYGARCTALHTYMYMHYIYMFFVLLCTCRNDTAVVRMKASYAVRFYFSTSATEDGDGRRASAHVRIKNMA